MTNLDSIQAGDKVLLHIEGVAHPSVEEVEKVTANFIILKRAGWKFARSSGLMTGTGSKGNHRFIAPYSQEVVNQMRAEVIQRKRIASLTRFRWQDVDSETTAKIAALLKEQGHDIP